MMTNSRTGSQVTSNPQFGVGVDIGGTKILVCVTDRTGNVVYRKKFDTTTDFANIYAYITECLDASHIKLDLVAAIGFGVPGITNSLEGVILEVPAFQWRNVPFRSRIQRYFDVPVFVGNDVNCAALGERWKGNAQNIDDFVFVAIGTGVGCAIVANGSLIEGYDYMAGEIGYFVVEDDIRAEAKHSLDSFGLFERRTSGVALSQYGYSSQQLFQLYAIEDPAAVVIVEKFIFDLSIGLANITSLLNPKKIVIGGGVSRSMDVVIGAIRTKVAELTPVPVSLELSALGEDAGALGAAALALQNWGRVEQRV